jgi:hypothetical protein
VTATRRILEFPQKVATAVRITRKEEGSSKFVLILVSFLVYFFFYIQFFDFFLGASVEGTFLFFIPWCSSSCVLSIPLAGTSFPRFVFARIFFFSW